MKTFSITGLDPASRKPIEVLIENGLIREIRPGPTDESAWLSPGFIDLQVNGYRGFDLNAESLDPDTVLMLTREVLATGVTTFLPTLITASEERNIAALQAIATARQLHPFVAHAVPFVHMEGPHISAEDGPRGAHPREHVRPPSLVEFLRWQAASHDLVGMVTMSPHWEKAPEYIAELARRGVLVSIGHSDATPEQIHAAAKAGATLSTHLGNGVAGQLPRHPNLLWAQLADERLTATLIADPHHLPADTLKAMLRAKGIENCVLISDAVALAGMPQGTYNTPVGGTVELSEDGRLSLAGTRFLAGAARPLKDGVAFVAGLSSFSLDVAVRMATRNPGRFVGQRGQLRVGADADLVRFDWNNTSIHIQSALVKGEPVDLL
jgi:N-acetylglucosamine-6-phosphate deacetylase